MPIDPQISSHDALRVEVLSEALPFIQRFSGRRVVIKYGGAAMVEQHLREAVFRDIALLASVGVRPVVVHGGGPEINQWLKRLAIEETILKRRKETRQEQVDSLNSRGAQSSHTIGFLMIKPLSNQTYINFLTIALLAPALYNIYTFGKQALVSAGIPPTRQIFTGQQNYRRRIG